MYKFKEDNMKVPCHVWSTKGSMEEKAIEQIKNASSLPFAFHHTALMPDGHVGYGAPIGGVLATKGVVIPNFVGVDIGCGMCAVKTSLAVAHIDIIKKIMGEIRKVIPVGYNKHKEKQGAFLMPTYKYDTDFTTCPTVKKEWDNAEKSIGTLGGGNHFIEIQKGNDGFIWIMIHSGSRNLGLQVAEHYNKLAYHLNKKWYSNTYLPPNPKDSLAFLPLDSEEGKAYLREMEYCVDFALANRKLMMDRVMEIFKDYTSCTFNPMINIAHNYTKMENHFGQNVMIHRKGATLAQEGTIGIIPGSQGTTSYIVKGKGNKDSFESCSHGAGRKMGRKDAQRRLNLEEEVKKLDEKGILHSIRREKDLDEAPGSYKDIQTVMENQKDLVEILVELTPIGVIKG